MPQRICDRTETSNLLRVHVLQSASPLDAKTFLGHVIVCWTAGQTCLVSKNKCVNYLFDSDRRFPCSLVLGRVDDAQADLARRVDVGMEEPSGKGTSAWEEAATQKAQKTSIKRGLMKTSRAPSYSKVQREWEWIAKKVNVSKTEQGHSVS